MKARKTRNEKRKGQAGDKREERKREKDREKTPVTEPPSFTCTGHPSPSLILLLNSFVEAKQAAEQPRRPLPVSLSHTPWTRGRNALKIYQKTILRTHRHERQERKKEEKKTKEGKKRNFFYC